MTELTTETTLYARIGGEASVRVAVDRFYERVLADPLLSSFFTGIPMARLKAHQIAFLSQVLGGPRSYAGTSMKDAHAKLAIEQEHFDAVTEHLVGTLRELGVSEELIAEIGRAVTSLSKQIVSVSSLG